MKVINYIGKKYCKHLIKDNLEYFFKECNLCTKDNKTPYIINIEIKEWGFTTSIDISGVCGYTVVENNKDYLKQLFKAIDIKLSNYKAIVTLEIILVDPGDLLYKPYILPSTKLLIGYNYKGEPLVADMLKTPHIGVQGLSNSGKSKMVETALINLIDSDITLLNVFKDDFKGVQAIRINGNDNILEYLKNLVNEPKERVKPLYVVIDELNVLNNDKKISASILSLLGQARHYNIYVIGIGQTLLKENCKYKHLFNVRVTFKVIDKSMVTAFLGCSIENTDLQQREFFLYADNIHRGKTYFLNDII